MHAYFDDARTFGNSDNVLLAGYLAEDLAWDEFGREWHALLTKHRLPYLHTSEFLYGAGKDYRESHGALTRDDRVAILLDFLEPIRQHTLCGFMVCISAPAWKTLMAPRKDKPTPQEFCFLRIMHHVMSEMASWTKPFPLSIVFDDSEYSMRFHSLYQNRKTRDVAFKAGVNGIAFADDKLVLPLQAADLLAWVVSKESHKPPGTWLGNSPFANIMNSPDPEYGKLFRAEHWDAPTIERHMADFLAGSWKGKF